MEENYQYYSDDGSVRSDAQQPVRKKKSSRRRRKKKKRRSFLVRLWSNVQVVLWAFILALVLCNFVIVNAVVPTGSMENTVAAGSRVIGNRLSYVVGDPQRGDIVIFKYPVDEDTLYLKRIIGLPGETVEIRDGGVYIDGSDTPLEEDYLPEAWVVGNDGYTFEVPEDCYLMLGDNRNYSLDARYWAEKAVEAGLASSEDAAQSYTYVKRSKILAKAVVVYWPISEWKLL